MNAYEQSLSSLNKEQLEAVESTAKQLRIIASPGSGKTHVLSLRAAKLLNNLDPQEKILVTTFTRKAANEVKTRVSNLLESYDWNKKALISGTFHSLAANYLRKYGKEVGLSNDFTIIDRNDAVDCVRSMLKGDSAYELHTKASAKGLIDQIGHLKANQIDLQSYLQSREKNPALASIYSEYHKFLKENDAVDFEDLLTYFLKLLRQRPGIFRRIKHVLVDEFQDSCCVQLDILYELCRGQNKAAFTIVGDPDQCIYSFRAAQIKNLTDINSAFPEVETVYLNQNYRSGTDILQAAQKIIEKSTDRAFQKEVFSRLKPISRPTLRVCDDLSDEAQWIAEEIKRLKNIKFLRYSDIAILVRVSRQTHALEKALAMSSIPFEIFKGRSFLESEEVRDILAYLKIVDHHDRISLLRVMNKPKRSIGPKSIERLEKFAADNDISIWQTIEGVINENNKQNIVSKKAFIGLESFYSSIQRLKKMTAQSSSVSDIIQDILDSSDINYSGFLQEKASDSREIQRRMGRISTLQKLNVKEEEEENDIECEDYDSSEDTIETPLRKFLDKLLLSADNCIDTKEGKVTISTVHGAKGLEWPIVFLPSVTSTMYPHSNAKTEEEQNEERRLLYVAMTRAKSFLYLSMPKRSNLGGDWSPQMLSEFLPGPNPEEFFALKVPSLTDDNLKQLSKNLNRPYGTIANKAISLSPSPSLKIPMTDPHKKFMNLLSQTTHLKNFPDYSIQFERNGASSGISPPPSSSSSSSSSSSLFIDSSTYSGSTTVTKLGILGKHSVLQKATSCAVHNTAKEAHTIFSNVGKSLGISRKRMKPFFH